MELNPVLTYMLTENGVMKMGSRGLEQVGQLSFSSWRVEVEIYVRTCMYIYIILVQNLNVFLIVFPVPIGQPLITKTHLNWILPEFPCCGGYSLGVVFVGLAIVRSVTYRCSPHARM